MATALAPRIYGLDAIGAAPGSAGSEEAPGFRPPPLSSGSPTRIWRPPRPSSAPPPPLALLAFARRRLPGVAKVRVFNPTAAEHGFESRHTVVQIVNDDMPFLVDSIANELNRREIAVHLLAHPVLPVRRDLDGDLLEVATEAGERARPESMMQIEIDRQADRAQLDDLAAALGRVLAEVRLAVGDWRAMRQACLDAVEDLLASRSPRLGEDEEFLRWLEANHFTFLGHRRYRYVEDTSAARRHALRAHARLGARHPAPRRGPPVRGGPRRRRGDVALRARAGQSPDRQDRSRMRWSIAAARWIASS